MKCIDILNIGEIVPVNRNFAFNYLIPFGFARYTTRSELIGLELETNYKEALVNLRKSSALQLKSRIGTKCTLEFEIPAEEDGSELLNMPLRPVHIIDKLKEVRYVKPLDLLREQDVNIHTNDGLVTRFGTYRATLTLDTDIFATVKIIVKPIAIDTSFI